MTVESLNIDALRQHVGRRETLTCSIHGWQWDLATGRCLTSDGHPLFARPQSDEAKAMAATAATQPPPGPDAAAGSPEGA